MSSLAFKPESIKINQDELIKILIVEDNTRFRENLSSHFQKDYSIDAVSSPAEATDLLKKNKYDLLLTDIRFEDTSVSGDEFIKQNSHLLEQAKIIAYTGYADDIATQNRALFDEILLKGRIDGLNHVEQTIQSIRQNKFSQAQADIVEESIALGLFQDELKVVSLAKDGKYKISDENKELHDILYTFTSETTELKNSIEELESLVNDRNSKEKDFQDFFNRNKDFILGEDYRNARPHIYLEKDDGKVLIPDFMLEPIDQAKLWDLLELKLPFAPQYNLKENRERYSTAVMEAYAQLSKYSAYFEEEKYREKINQKYGLTAFKPKMFVIIGRNKTINPIDRKQIESMFPSLNVKSYDEIIERKKYKLENWIKGRKA